jgi:carbamoyl-phosphate synthase large subunit
MYPKSVVVKSSQFSFSRLLGADPVLRVEMSSTGEVACFGRDYDEALIKSICSTNKFDFSKKAVLVSLGGLVNKAKFLEAARALSDLGYKIFATDSTAKFFLDNGVNCMSVRKASEQAPNVLDSIEKKQVAFVVNLSDPTFKKKKNTKLATDGFRIRRATVDNQIPLFTDLHLARAFVKALSHYGLSDLEIKSYKEYLNG